jgi:hypothetical protein
MNLKKSDKIIAITAVVILIIAAIGVVLYTDKEPDEVLPEENEMILYTVDVEPRQAPLTLDNTDYFMKNKKPYTGTIEVPCDNLKGVDIYIEYEDKDIGFLLKKGRQNTITVTVYDEADSEICTTQIMGMGNETLKIPGSNPLDIDQIKAKDITDAEARLEENLSNTGLTKTYTIEVSVKHGESILRPIMWLLEKLGKDSFTPEITYEYYSYILEEQKLDDDGDDDLSEESLNPTVVTYRTLGLPGKH